MYKPQFFFYIFRCINNTYEKEAIAITNADAAVNSIANTADGTTDGNYWRRQLYMYFQFFLHSLL